MKGSSCVKPKMSPTTIINNHTNYIGLCACGYGSGCGTGPSAHMVLHNLGMSTYHFFREAIVCWPVWYPSSQWRVLWVGILVDNEPTRYRPNIETTASQYTSDFYPPFGSHIAVRYIPRTPVRWYGWCVLGKWDNCCLQSHTPLWPRLSDCTRCLKAATVVGVAWKQPSMVAQSPWSNIRYNGNKPPVCL